MRLLSFNPVVGSGGFMRRTGDCRGERSRRANHALSGRATQPAAAGELNCRHQGRSAPEAEMVTAALPELHPVVEAPWFEGAPPWPWPIADHKAFVFFRLSSEMTAPEVGSVMAQLV